MKKEKQTDIELLLIEIKKLNEINNSKKQVIAKALLNGLFTSLGATFGFAILVLLLGYIVDWVGGVPILSKVYEDSGLKTIIDYQLQQIDKRDDGDVNGVSTGSGAHYEDEYMPPTRF